MALENPYPRPHVAGMTVARNCRYGTTEDVAKARQELKASKIAEAIRQNLEAAPPLSPAQIQALTGMLQYVPADDAREVA